MAFVSADLIIEGALDESKTFEGTLDSAYHQLDEWVSTLRRERSLMIYPEPLWNVYIVTHAHDLDSEGCECAQYLQDHSPYAVI